ncbi:MAG: SUMF1/EgtB/PvdO family nonheme iron enzyme [Eubacteriales bacterium]
MKRKMISIIALLLALLLLAACSNTTFKKGKDSHKEQSIITNDPGRHDNNTENTDNTEYANSQTNGDQQGKPDTYPEEISMLEGSNGIFNYLLYTPENAAGDMPLIVYLHGSRSQGDDLHLLTAGDDLPKYFAEGKIRDVPAYILFPQLSSEYSDWISVRVQLIELVTDIIRNYNIDKNKVSLTGFSMGGTGTWNIAVYYPDTFSCIAPLSGSIKTTDSNLSKLKRLKIWAFVGDEDDRIAPYYSVDFVEAFNKAGGDAKVTVFEGASHVDVPAMTYTDENIGLLQWLCTTNKKAEISDGNSNMFENSAFIETEQPELDGETKALISLYKRKPTLENYISLRAAVIKNYDAVLVRKEAKLAELKEDTAGKPGGAAKVADMEEIVQEMYKTYWNRINSSMLRFTDPRILSWKVSDASEYEYIPVMGAGDTIYVKRTTVTNAEYARYIKATGAKAPSNWVGGNYPAGEENYPVNYISYSDAMAYCAWLTENDGVNTYRLPNESEWELAAGHMPKDALFNCGINECRTPVEQYAKDTRGAHGAVDFWGNVWEWTTTVRSTSGINTSYGVKGGAWNSARTDCRTEYRKEGRDGSEGYEDVGFRVIMVLNGEEPDQKVELATLDAPTVAAVSNEANSVELSWKAVDGANAYQLFSYSQTTGLVEMLQVTENTFVKFKNLESGTTYYYIVQPISYKEIADNVSSEYIVKVTCK